MKEKNETELLKAIPANELVQAEKDRLDILEKRVEIRKKRVEILKEQQAIEEARHKLEHSTDQQRLVLDMIHGLRILLADYTIDGERTTLPGEPFLKPLLTNQEQAIVAKKLIELVRKL